MTNPGSLRKWRIESERILHTSRVFVLGERTSVSRADPTRRGDFVFLRAADWVNVIAITPEREVVLVEQYRHGLDEVTLEIPGGIVDPGESPAQTAARELLEETGYAPAEGDAIAHVRMIGRVSANPAILTNHCHTALIEGVTLRAGQNLDEREEIAVRLVPLAEIPGMIRGGAIDHSLVVAAFNFLWLRG